MKTVLIATDGSDSAREAVMFGLELAADEHGRVVFVHVAPATDVYPTGAFGMTAAVPHELTETDRLCLDDAEALAEEFRVPARSRLLRGDVVKEILDHASLVGADLIVVGSRGHGMLAGALLGSVSRALLHDADRPVLVVRGTRVAEPVAAAS